MRSIHSSALAFAVGLLAVNLAPAAPPPSPLDPAAVQALHQIVAVLNGANHDYDGHRAAAVHEVHKAIHALHPHHKLPQLGTAKPAVKDPAVKEDQKVSDAQLAIAMQSLQTLQMQIATSTTAHHQKALVHTQAAIAELKIALAIK